MLRAVLLIFLLFGAASSVADTITVRILSKYHPQDLQVSTRSRIFHLHPGEHSVWQFSAEEGEDIHITVNGKQKRIYRGGIRAEWSGTEYRVENRTPLEVYVAGVVAGELGSGWRGELVKAQAVLARTYALKIRTREHLSDLAYHQVFKGFDSYAQQIYPVSVQTRGEVLKYKGKLAEPLFHAECGSSIYHAGQFWSSEETGVAVALPAVIPAGRPWRAKLSDDQIMQVFPNASQLVRIDRQHPVVIDTGDSQRPVEAFRLMINRRFGWNTIPSNEFQIVRQTGGWQLEGRGRGHLVGLCQQQAGKLANSGWGYQDILRLFYPGMAISARL